MLKSTSCKYPFFSLKQQILMKASPNEKKAYISMFGFVKEQKLKFKDIVLMPNLDRAACFKRSPVGIVTWMMD